MMAYPIYTTERRNSRLQFILYVVLSIISATLQIKGVSLCPSQCTCSNSTNRVTVNCYSRGLTSIPSEFPSDSYSIDLRYNTFTIVENGSFNNYSVLDNIYLSSCKIHVIQSGAFVMLPKLRTLNLDNNNISTISSETFVGLANLREINIQRSKVKHIAKAAFKDLVNLQYMFLSSNDISEIDGNVFGNLPLLSTLLLDHNSISTLTKGTFVGLKYLSTLYLHDNKVNKIEIGAIHDLQNLFHLYLQNNDLSMIDNTTFPYLPRLYSLDLGNNKIAEIQPSSFTNLTNLRILKLTNNSISDVKQDYFNGVSFLDEIWMDKNNVTYIEEGVFQNMPALTVLALNLYCDCSIIPFWNWLKLVGKYGSTITCFERNGAFLPSLPRCAFDKCNGTVCPDNFCTNGGTCFVNSFGDPSCLCPGDWTGAKCYVHPCHNNPCGFNGVCGIDVYQTATCQCYGNWTGQYCERSPCETQVCNKSMCYYNDTGASICLNLHDIECTENTTTEDTLTTQNVYETSKEQTTEPVTTERKLTSRTLVPSTIRVTSPAVIPSPTPCIGGGLNRTDARLDEECGTHSEDAKCIVSNSACTGTSIASTWRCRCVQGYAKKNNLCLQLPTKLFRKEYEKVSKNLPESSLNGHQVIKVNFTEVDGFYKISPTAEMMGSGSDSFSLNTANTENVVVTVNSEPLSKSKYEFFVVVSVTVDGIVIRDFIHVVITITRNNIIEKNILVIDRTPKDSVVGLVCQSCLSGDAVTTITPDDVVSVEKDGSIKTTTYIHLDTLGGPHTIAYSSYIQVKQNGHLVANITILIVRLQYTQSLTEDSGRNTIVGLFKLSIPFSIDTPELALNDNSLMLGSVSLDYQREKEEHKTLVLSVSGVAFNIQIIIKVKDVNNKAPVFLGAPYRFVTVQSAYTDLTVGVVTAVDLDMHANLTYGIIPSDKLSINKNGVISIHQQFDPSTTIYNATVTVRDGIYNDSEEITVDIRKAANVELNKTFNGTIDENEGAPTVIVTVNVSEYENYRFADQSAKNDFTIDSKTGEIRNARAFDREKEQEFKLTIVANKENEATCSLAVIGVVTISVTDVNDEPPIFVGAPYTATVVEEGQNKELLVVPVLSTTDKDINQTVVYSILTNEDKFVIDQTTGTIKTKVPIDREKKPLLDIKVNAFDGIHNNYTTVTVKIMDVNDNDPVITGPKSYNVSEDSSVGTSVGLLTASDADEGNNAKITFDLVTDGGYFRIDQITGNILVSRQLDREAVKIHQMTVYARDNGDNIRQSSATVIVTIDDVNDNAPVFGQNQVTVLFKENSSCSNSITTISASDADQANTPNSQIEYFLTRGEDNFRVNQQSGILTCNYLLDYEQKASYEIIIEARDKGSPQLSSAQIVMVQVIDINDNSPIFVDIKSQIIIRYCSPERVVEVFKATDMDSAENGKVHFNISGNATKFLQIGKVDGILRTLTNPCPQGNYSLNVTVTDNGNPPLKTTNPLVVIANLLTEQPIKFTMQEISMHIPENSPQNSSLESVKQYVSNTKNKTLMFDIIDESGDLSFSLGGATGLVTLIKDIDREMKGVHEFVIHVRSTDNAEHSDLALVRVTIEDENDNKPLFVQKAYFFTINENELIGTAVSPPERKIMATDADSGDNALIEFKLYGEGCLSAFRPNYEGSNTMVLQLADQVDYEVNQRCSFTVEAFNPNDITKSSNVSVVINIIDYNDNVPEFKGHTNHVYTISLPEDTNINTNQTSFGLVRDEDSRENGDIELYVVNDISCWFTVYRVADKMFLKVKPTIILDYDKGDVQNTCTLKASDKGVPKLSSTATLSINLTDVNDNPPFISEQNIILNVSRDADPGTVIVDRISATDIDSGVNGMLVYRLESSEHSSRFAIDANTGKITINTVLQSVQKDEIMLSVIVSDKGLPQRSTRAQVTIKIKDDNPRPFFVDPSVSVDIQEHTNIENGILGVVEAHDRRDSGEINTCDCTYLLDTKRGDIIIGKDTGVIKFRNSNHTLDRENEDGGHVIVGVIATDKGEHPKNSSTMQFKIKIKDINDQVPVFNQINYAFGIFQFAPNETYIGEVNAVDLDENPETHYSINITESSVGSVVTIDKFTGKIVKSGDMSLSSAQNVKIKGNVFAQDGKDLKKPRSHAEIIITIEFDDKNNHTPVFQKNAYEKDVDWNSPAGFKIVKVNATDEDDGKEGKVTLSIIDGNTREFFAINDDGQVVLKYQLDSSIGEDPTVIVHLTIKAEDSGIIPKSSNVTVKLRIFGKNPGACIQGAEHSRELLNIENERDSWSYALYGLVAALCLAILLSFVFLYKWRTSPVSETTPPVGKMKYFDNPIPYDHLRKRETVEYSHSNESFDPPSRNFDFPDDKDQYQRVTEPEGEASFRRPPDNKPLHASRPLSFDEPTPDYPVYESEGKDPKPAMPSTSRTSENC